MSGSSSSGRPYSGSQSGGSVEIPKQDCTSIGGITKVISPTMPFFISASVGDALRVELDDAIISLLNKTGDSVGVINPTWSIKLVECLKKGNQYEAIIKNINGASIDVFIQHVS
jgi:hypothetical protein